MYHILVEVVLRRNCGGFFLVNGRGKELAEESQLGWRRLLLLLRVVGHELLAARGGLGLLEEVGGILTPLGLSN
jgi:hypothetical protein